MKRRFGGRERDMIFCWKSAPKSVKMFQKSENKRIKDKSNSRTGHKAAQKCDP